MVGNWRGRSLVCVVGSLAGLGCTMESGETPEDLGEVRESLTLVFASARDAQISSTSPTSNFGLTSGCSVAGGEVEKSCLLKWDLNTIPTNALVDQVLFYYEVYDASPETFYLHQVNASWSEISTTWFKRDDTSNWTTPGCNRVPSDRASAPVGSFIAHPGHSGIGLNSLGRAMVQNWIANPSANKGFIIRANTAVLDSMAIRSNQSSTGVKPRLVISYHLP